jgi:trk system potassium uptake protein TrkH
LGLANDDFNTWPYFAALWMLFLGSFAPSAGSTGGGIKMMRAILLYQQVFREFTRLLHPKAEVPIKLGNTVVPNKVMYAVLAFFFIYVSSIVVLSLLLTMTGLDVFTSFTAIVATINSTGPGLGQVGPATTYAILTDLQTWICIFSMLLGRLELFTLLVVLSPTFWRK